MARQRSFGAKTTALCVLPPRAIGDTLDDAYRRALLKGYTNWAAHVNVMWPFMPLEYDEFARDAARLAEAIA